MGETCLEIRGVSKRFGNITAVDNVSLTIERGEFFSLLGPSGCGKTTLLRMIAGFEKTTEGEILIDGQDIAPLPPYRRPVNTVFQHYALFPHMNIFQNVAFGLERKQTPKSEITKIVNEALEQVRLMGFEKRRPSQMSGGQKQRVALARALVLRPQVLLLDEPLGALDMKLRKEMQVELKNLQEQLKITFVFVTHDQEEALVMSDRIAIMNHGKLEQVGKSCSEIFERPRTQFVAHFMGAPNILHGKIRREGGRAVLHIPNGPSFDVESSREGDVRFVVRPEKLNLHAQPAGSLALPVRIADEIFQGTNTSWVVKHDGEELIVVEQNLKAAEDEARFRRGDLVYLSWDPRNTVILED